MAFSIGMKVYLSLELMEEEYNFEKSDYLLESVPESCEAALGNVLRIMNEDGEAWKGKFQ